MVAFGPAACPFRTRLSPKERPLHVSGRFRLTGVGSGKSAYGRDLRKAARIDLRINRIRNMGQVSALTPQTAMNGYTNMGAFME